MIVNVISDNLKQHRSGKTWQEMLGRQQLSQVSSLWYRGHSTPTIFYRLIVDCVLRQDSAALVTLAMHLNHLTCLSARLLTMD